MKSGWAIKKLGELGTIVRGKGIRRNETVDRGLPCIRYGEIYTSYNYILDCPHSFVSKDVFARCPKIKEGDVVFTLTGENKDEIAKALAYLGKDEIAAGGDLAIWSKHGCDPKFLAYMMYAPKLIEAKARASNGDIIVHASVKKMQEIDIPLPPLSEQKRIVAKIDAAFEKIDKLKANAEKNLANAKDLFQSALDEAMRPKDGWVEKRLGEVGTTLTGTTPSTRDKSNFGNFMPFVKPADIMSFNPINYREEGLSQKGVSCSRLIKSDSVLMVCIGASIGKTGYADRDCTCNQQINALMPNGFDGRYLYYMLSSDKFKKKLMEDAGQATLPIINKSKWENLSICVSLSLSEQREIVNRLDLLAEKIKILEQNYTKQIADCAEMRQAVLREAFEGRL